MSNTCSVSDAHWYDKNHIGRISATATASYRRDGSKVTCTISVEVSSSGAYSWNADIAPSPSGAVPSDSAYTTVVYKENTTKYITYTYDNSSAKTYYFYIKTYVQAIQGVTGKSAGGTTDYRFEIYVPAGGATPWIKVNNQWKKGTYIYTKVNGTWKKGITRSKVSGTWKM